MTTIAADDLVPGQVFRFSGVVGRTFVVVSQTPPTCDLDGARCCDGSLLYYHDNRQWREEDVPAIVSYGQHFQRKCRGHVSLGVF